LLVDDEQSILNSICRLLFEEPYDVLTFDNPREALEILHNASVSLVVSDYKMPEMDGITFLEEARRLHPDAPRIILSGYLDIDAITECVNRAGAYKFIIKPWNDDDLKLTIRKALEHFDLVMENRRLYETVTQQNRRLVAFNEELEQRVRERTQELSLRNQALILSQDILENLFAAIVGISNEGFVVFVNKRANMVFGQDRGSLMSYHIDDAFSGELLEVVRRTAREQRPVRWEDFLYSGHRLSLSCFPLGGTFKGKGIILEATEAEGCG
jgi:two-component system NtrC family sensor kinase